MPLVLGVAVAGALGVRVAGRARVGVREPLVAGGAVLAWAALAALAQDAGGGSQARVWLLAAAAAAAVVAATVALRPPSGEQGTMAP